MFVNRNGEEEKEAAKDRCVAAAKHRKLDLGRRELLAQAARRGAIARLSHPAGERGGQAGRL